ncbi:MAG: AAA domain-containing protein [Chloroflexi bacterium]|nr:AAA domain-containing protein [Chloroflexota bacterium]
MSRRIGGSAGDLYGVGRVEALFAEAQEGGGVVQMTHPFSGVTLDVDLDALPVLMEAGYLPEDWAHDAGHRVVGKDNRVCQVVDPGDLPFAPEVEGDPIREAAQAYGLDLSAGAVVANALTPSFARMEVNDQARGASPFIDIDTAKEYDVQALMGSEFRSQANRGKPAWIGSPHYKIGDRVKDARHYSSRRDGHQRKLPLVVGRNLPTAAASLTHGDFVIEENAGFVEVYRVEDDGEELVAVYDPDSRLVGTPFPENNSTMTPAQVLAYAYGEGDPELRLEMAETIEGDELRLADSMYLFAKDDMGQNGSVYFGGFAQAERCSTCGRFTGSAPHMCPGPTQQSEPAAAAEPPTVVPEPEPAAATEPPTAVPEPEPATATEPPTAVPESEPAAATEPPTAVPEPEPATATEPPTAVPESEPAAAAEPPTAVPEPEPTAETATQKGIRPDGRPVTPDGQLTAQELIMKDTILPAPDPWLSNVPTEWGGQLEQPLNENVATVDPSYVLDSNAERVLDGISASLQLAEKMPAKHAYKMRSFGIYGPAGTGKNSLARQLAASIRVREADGTIRQGIGVIERTVAPDSTAKELIGSAVLEATPEGGTRSRVALGPLGQAAATGSVVCVNEIARNPKLASAFQSMIEDGVIEIETPEAGTVHVPVHPATTFVFTWNPGYEGDADRPGQAPLSRMTTFKLDAPGKDEVVHRAATFMQNMGISVNGVKVPDQVQLKNSYKIPENIEFSDRELDRATDFWMELRHLSTPTSTQMAKLGGKSMTPTTPGQREYQRFLLLSKAIGPARATETFKVICDQDEDFPAQWSLIKERFRTYYGFDM